MHIVNISGYQFVELTRLPLLKEQLQAWARAQQLMGTILLAEEGINLMLAGEETGIDAFIAQLAQDERFAHIYFKRSHSDFVPFSQLKVKIKPEIITIGDRTINLDTTATNYLAPQTFKAWLDAGKPMTVLDTRNDYEVSAGTFHQAVDLNIAHFRDFPVAVKQLPTEAKQQPVVMFCTGGIRCEKASEILLREGYSQVYQLHGGIIQYFAECGGAHYQGNCFVFDDRVLLDPKLATVQPCLES